MPSYDDFITKADSFRAKLLRDRAYKRLDIAKQTWDNVRSTVSYILNQLQSLISYEARYNVHRYSVEAYLTSKANQIGERAVKVSYNDSTETVDSYEVPSYARFSYDEADYQNKLKQLTPEIAKQYFKFAIPVSESPPTGDVEDVAYAYYFPDTVEHHPYYQLSLVGMTLPKMIDYGIFGLEIKQYGLGLPEGEMVYIKRTIDGADVEAWIVLNATAEITDPDTNETYKQAFKFFVYIQNYTSYTVILTLYGHKLKADSNKAFGYVMYQDVRIFPNPIKVWKGELA